MKFETNNTTLDQAFDINQPGLYEGQMDDSSPQSLDSYPAPDKAIIAREVIVRGGLTVETKLCVAGTVHGDVYGKQSIDSKAGFEIQGNINAESFLAIGGTVNGNIHCQDHIEIDPGSSVKGNLEADSIIINGVNEGDVLGYSSVRLAVCCHGQHKNQCVNCR